MELQKGRGGVMGATLPGGGNAWCVCGLKFSLAWLKGGSQPRAGGQEMGGGEVGQSLTPDHRRVWYEGKESKQCCVFQKFKCLFQYKSNPCSSRQLVSNRKIGNVKLNIQNSNTPMTMVISWSIFLQTLSTFVYLCYVVEGSRAGN